MEEPKCVTPWISFILMLITLFGHVTSDMEKDRNECAEQLVGLAPCLTYVSGEAKSPTPDCCSGLKGVIAGKSKKCLCILVKDRDDPSLGIKLNANLALGLPDKCHAPANVSQCPDLLHLAHNSPDAKVFEDFNNSVKGGSNTTSVPAVGVKSNPSGEARKADVESDGGMKWQLMGSGLFVSLLVHVLSL